MQLLLFFGYSNQLKREGFFFIWGRNTENTRRGSGDKNPRKRAHYTEFSEGYIFFLYNSSSVAEQSTRHDIIIRSVLFARLRLYKGDLKARKPT